MKDTFDWKAADFHRVVVEEGTWGQREVRVYREQKRSLRISILYLRDKIYTSIRGETRKIIDTIHQATSLLYTVVCCCLRDTITRAVRGRSLLSLLRDSIVADYDVHLGPMVRQGGGSLFTLFFLQRLGVTRASDHLFHAVPGFLASIFFTMNLQQDG